MTPSVDQLKATLSELPASDRAELAHYLLKSMEPIDAHADQAWRDELDRRIAEIRSGAELGVPLEDVLNRLRNEFP